MINKLECTCIDAYKSRKMRDPNCCACSCDHNDLVEQLAKANERVRELESDLKIALSDKTLDLVRCGIGGNYGGDCYETAMLKYHSPLVELKEQLRKGQE